jgi:hypothetical protein
MLPIVKKNTTMLQMVNYICFLHNFTMNGIDQNPTILKIDSEISYHVRFYEKIEHDNPI